MEIENSIVVVAGTEIPAVSPVDPGRAAPSLPRPSAEALPGLRASDGGQMPFIASARAYAVQPRWSAGVAGRLRLQ